MKNNTFLENRDKRNIVLTREILATLPYYCSQYLASIQNNTSTLTQLNYAHDLKQFFYYLTHILLLKENPKNISLNDLSSLKANDFEEYMNWLTYYIIDNKEYRNSACGKSRKLASLRSFFKYLFKRDMITSNELDKIPTPKIHEKEIVRLEPNEMCDVLDEVEKPDSKHFSTRNLKYIRNLNSRDLAIMYLFLSTGIRISELVGIDIDDINFDENAFKIFRKGGNSAVMYFPEETKEMLVKYSQDREKIKPLLGHENAFFLSSQRKRISVRAVENLVKKYTQNVVQLKNITPHKLRSTFGTNLYRETQDIYIVATMLGHKDVNTTKKHYAAISEDLKRETAKNVKLRN